MVDTTSGPDEPQGEPEAQPEGFHEKSVVAEIRLIFYADGTFGADFKDAKTTQLWAGAEYLRQVGGGLFADQRMAAMQRQMQQQQEAAQLAQMLQSRGGLRRIDS